MAAICGKYRFLRSFHVSEAVSCLLKWTASFAVLIDTYRNDSLVELAVFTVNLNPPKRQHATAAMTRQPADQRPVR